MESEVFSIYTIMIVEDDTYIGDMLEETLRREGYETVRAYSGTEAAMLLEKVTPSLVLLDLTLPGMNGNELLPMIKGAPVIVVSARAEVEGKVKLLLEGASDYVTKPFDISELLARIKVRLRDNAPHRDNASSDESSESNDKRILRAGGLSLDPDSHIVEAGSVSVKLTRTEYAILRRLLLNPTQVLTKSQLLDLISEDTPDCVESSLKVHVSNLRKKLREADGEDHIEAVWGIGFKLKL